jgi:hypothetical protein
MRNLILPFAAMLPACATAAPQPPAVATDTAAAGRIPLGSPAGGPVCRRFDSRPYVGREATPELAAELRRASGAKTVRWVRPGMLITMEYREDRLTAHVDARNRVIRANCG